MDRFVGDGRRKIVSLIGQYNCCFRFSDLPRQHHLKPEDFLCLTACVLINTTLISKMNFYQAGWYNSNALLFCLKVVPTPDQDSVQLPAILNEGFLWSASV
jgi:hypothetical protein